MTIKCLIVDDEPLARELVRAVVARDPELDLVGECRNGGEAVDMTVRMRPELVFLDIQMPDKSGFDVLRDIPPTQLLEFIFITAYDHFAVDAFERNAIDYVLKPFKTERLEEAIARAKSRIVQRSMVQSHNRVLELLAERTRHEPATSEYLAVRSGNRQQIIKTADIEWIQADGQYIWIHRGGKAIPMRDSLQNLELKLDPNRFCRVHRSALINVGYLKTVDRTREGEYRATMSDGSQIALSKAGRKRLKNMIGLS